MALASLVPSPMPLLTNFDHVYSSQNRTIDIQCMSPIQLRMPFGDYKPAYIYDLPEETLQCNNYTVHVQCHSDYCGVWR